MGFEVIYHYRSNNSDASDEAPKTASVKVGSPYEEVPVEVLAGKIMALMARRNVFVTHVEVYEIVKKPISFKESEDGIIIKNKKFKFDDGPEIKGEDCNQGQAESVNNQDIQALLKNPQVISLLQSNANPVHPHQVIETKPVIPTGSKVIRREYYFPDDVVWVEQAKAINPDHAFTEKKLYPILRDKILRPVASMSGGEAKGEYYETIDDKNRRQIVNSKLFSPTLPQLSNGFDQSSEGSLSWDGNNYDVPDIRRR